MLTRSAASIDCDAVLKAMNVNRRSPDTREMDGFGLGHRWPLARSLVSAVWEQIDQDGVATIRIAGFAALPRRTYLAVAVAISSLFGIPTTTLGSAQVVWDVRPGEGGNISSSLGAADFHTDSSFRPVPERLFGLWCLRQAKDGGDSMLIDVNDLLRSLDGDDHTALSTLSTHVVPFFNGRDLLQDVVLDTTNSSPKIRYRRDVIEAGMARKRPPHVVEIGRALDVLAHHLSNPALVKSIRLAEDEVLFVDNHRMLHGRSSFQDPNRHLLRVRVDVPQQQ